MYPELRAYFDEVVRDSLVRSVMEEMGMRAPRVAPIGAVGVDRRLAFWKEKPRSSLRIELNFPGAAVPSVQEWIGMEYFFRHAPYDLVEGGKVVDPPPLAVHPDRWVGIVGLPGFSAEDEHRAQITLEHFRHFILHFPSRWAGIAASTRAAKGLLQDPPDMAWPITILGAELAAKADVKSIEWAGASVERLSTGALWIQCGENPFEPNAAVLKRVWKFLPGWDEIRTPS